MVTSTMDKIFRRNFRFPLKQRITVKLQYLVFSKLFNNIEKVIFMRRTRGIRQF